MLTKGSLRLRLLLLTVIIVFINILAVYYFFRLDFTADNRYTLSDATKDILEGVEEPLTITAYFSEDIHPDIDRSRQEFKEMLIEYASRANGNIDYKFINPNKSAELEEEAQQAGIPPRMVQARERDQYSQKRTYLGAVLEYGQQKEVIPVLPPGAAIEYALSSIIKKITVTDKPMIGLVQGHGEPSVQALAQAAQSMSILYNLGAVNLMDTSFINQYKTIAIVAPADSFNVIELQNLERYLAAGKGVYMALNLAEGDFSTGMGNGAGTGLEAWLESKGLKVNSDFVLDANCGNVSVRRQTGMFSFNQPVKFPYFPIIKKFAEHQITNGIEEVLFNFASSMEFNGTGDDVSFTPLIYSSELSSIEVPPFAFDVSKEWTQNDFPNSSLVLGGVLEGNLSSGLPSKIVVYGDGDFAVNGEGQGARNQPEDNINLMVNAIDWLSDDTGLNELRTKTISSRPIEKELTDGERNLVKALNFLVPILLIALYGVVRWQARNRRKRKLKKESYV